jgi:acetyl-CoA carboxylase carboxyl transferase subunit alpha
MYHIIAFFVIKIKSMKNYLEFENEVRSLEENLDKLKDPYNSDGLTEVQTEKINDIELELKEKLSNIYSNLNPWQKTLVARHEERPKAKYFIENLFDDFVILSGDRHFSDDKAVLAGFATFENRSILVIGQEKGNDLDTRIKSNFGMMKSEGYKKCIRLMKLAEKFNIPIISFIDTPGASPEPGSEERGIAESIAKSIETSMSLRVPNISIIIGEGGSGGAIALASSNKVIMLENAIYSVISPEGCAAILWRDPKKTLEASQAMKLSANDLLNFGVIDEVVKEPIGGAHRDKIGTANQVRDCIRKNLDELSILNHEQILNQRKQKFLSIGREKGFGPSHGETDKLSSKSNLYLNFKRKIFQNKIYTFVLGAAIFLLLFLGIFIL